jgi:endonuclease/exonuclease/phosphatase family metal-dependent hydrolase
MKAIDKEKRKRLGAMLDTASQQEVMALIPQFSETETGSFAKPAEYYSASPSQDGFGAMVFNIERGVRLRETIDFLKYCPDIRPFDLILANELDDGCTRSGGVNVAETIAKEIGANYAYGLEFIELANEDEPKGYHGNAIFTRFPILWSETFRLPEENNWYFDRQKRIGGRCAIFAKLDIGGREIGVASVHLENRTDGAGRRRQMAAIFQEADRVFPNLPVLIGGDLNTNTFDGRCVPAIEFLSAHPQLLLDQMRHLEDYEPCLKDAEELGYSWRSAASKNDDAGLPIGTRRKSLPDGSDMLIRLDWLLPKGLKASDGKTISTLTRDCGFAPNGSALSAFEGKELSDHNAVWARFI